MIDGLTSVQTFGLRQHYMCIFELCSHKLNKTLTYFAALVKKCVIALTLLLDVKRHEF